MIQHILTVNPSPQNTATCHMFFSWLHKPSHRKWQAMMHYSHHSLHYLRIDMWYLWHDVVFHIKPDIHQDIVMVKGDCLDYAAQADS